MSQSVNWNKSKKDRQKQLSRGRGISFRFWEKSRASPNAALLNDPFDEDQANNPLRYFQTYPGGTKPRDFTEKDLVFIDMNVTPRSRAAQGLAGLRSNYLCHTFNVSKYDTGDGDGDLMLRWFTDHRSCEIEPTE